MVAKLRELLSLPMTRRVSLVLLGCVVLLAGVVGTTTRREPESTLFPPPQEADRLNDQVWSWIADAECPRPEWTPDFTSTAAYRASIEPLRSQLLARTGPMPAEAAGDVIERHVITGTATYSIEWLRVSSRLPDVSVTGYLVLPATSNGAKPSPSVVLVPGVGVPPHLLFGWRLAGESPHVKYAGETPVTAVGQALIRAGYAVFIPWINDERGNYPGTQFEERDWARFPWFELSAWGAVNRRYGNGGDEHGLTVPSLMAAVDFFRRERPASPIAAVGWEAGAELAAVTAAVDERVAAVVMLTPVLDTRAQFADPSQLQSVAPFTALGCSFGHLELAALIAPRPLLFATGEQDPLHARLTSYASEDIYNQIKAVYGALRSGDFAQISSDDATSEANTPVDWLSHELAFETSVANEDVAMPRSPRDWVYSSLEQIQVRRQVASYLEMEGHCEPVLVRADYASPQAFAESMKPVRQELVADVVGDLPPEQPVVVTERQLVRSLPDYTLEWVRFRARFTDIEVGGYLATPNDREEGAPAVLSLDGNYDQGWLYGLKPAPFVYLNQYGDALARSGYVVFSPYMPSTLADGWGALLGATPGYRQDVWSYLVPLNMSGLDLLRSEPAVDKDRMAVYGISFAGYAALLTAAIDERIAAVVD
jgi:dienelactone hydrolase